MPTGLTAASNGLLYIADADNQRVMRIKLDQLELNNALAPAK